MTALSDKIIIVTGAGSGIGAATAEACVAEGARVVVAGRRRDRLDELVRRIGSGRARAVRCDVSVRAEVESMVADTLEAEGRIDALINNAGVMPLGPMTACRVEDWERTMAINVMGTLYGIGAVLPAMLDRGSGHIVNVSSTAGRRVYPLAAVYCASKHAVHALSEGLRAELAEPAKGGTRIRVTVVAPGYVETDLASSITHEATRAQVAGFYGALPDPLKPRDIADAIVYALAAPEHVNVNEIVVRPTTSSA